MPQILPFPFQTCGRSNRASKARVAGKLSRYLPAGPQTKTKAIRYSKGPERFQ